MGAPGRLTALHLASNTDWASRLVTRVAAPNRLSRVEEIRIGQGYRLRAHAMARLHPLS